MATVEECIAHLHEELNLTTAFTGAMVRMGNYRAALGVVEEQRSRVHQIPAHFDRAFARPRRKAKAAIAGLAAAALLGSGAFAAWVAPNKSEAMQTQRRIQKAVDMIEAAANESSKTVAESYVDVATSALTGLDPNTVPPPDSLTPKELDRAFRLLGRMNKVSERVLNAALAAARGAGLKVTPPPAPEHKPGTTPPAPPPPPPAPH
jgi:hypothetical protein